MHKEKQLFTGSMSGARCYDGKCGYRHTVLRSRLTAGAVCTHVQLGAGVVVGYGPHGMSMSSTDFPASGLYLPASQFTHCTLPVSYRPAGPAGFDASTSIDPRPSSCSDTCSDNKASVAAQLPLSESLLEAHWHQCYNLKQSTYRVHRSWCPRRSPHSLGHTTCRRWGPWQRFGNCQWGTWCSWLPQHYHCMTPPGTHHSPIAQPCFGTFQRDTSRTRPGYPQSQRCPEHTGTSPTQFPRIAGVGIGRRPTVPCHCRTCSEGKGRKSRWCPA